MPYTYRSAMTPLRLDKSWVSSLKLAAGAVSTENSSMTIRSASKDMV